MNYLIVHAHAQSRSAYCVYSARKARAIRRCPERSQACKMLSEEDVRS